MMIRPSHRPSLLFLIVPSPCGLRLFAIFFSSFLQIFVRTTNIPQVQLNIQRLSAELSICYQLPPSHSSHRKPMLLRLNLTALLLINNGKPVLRIHTISLSLLLAYTSRCKPWESLLSSSVTTPRWTFTTEHWYARHTKNPSLHNGTRAVLIYPSRIHILFLLLRLCKQDV